MSSADAKDCRLDGITTHACLWGWRFVNAKLLRFFWRFQPSRQETVHVAFLASRPLHKPTDTLAPRTYSCFLFFTYWLSHPPNAATAQTESTRRQGTESAEVPLGQGIGCPRPRVWASQSSFCMKLKVIRSRSARYGGEWLLDHTPTAVPNLISRP